MITQEYTLDIVCSKSELLKGILQVQNAISSKSTLPVLSNILLEAKRTGLQMAATDLEVGIRCMVKAEILKDGATTVPGKIFVDFVKTLKDGEDIKIQLDPPTRVCVQSSKSKCMMVGLPKEDFPVLPDFAVEKVFHLETALLREMIKKTIFAVSTDETRYILNGVCLMLNKDTARMVATDGRRLSYIQRALKGQGVETAAVIPTKALNEVLRLLNSEDIPEQIAVSITENQAGFRLGETVIVTRLIEGRFPNYEQVIPKSATIHTRVSTEELLVLTQRAALGVGDRGGAIEYSFERNSLRARGAAQGRVEVEDEMPVEFQGPPFKIAFNPNFVLDVLKNVESKEVEMELGGALNPGLIRPVGDETHLCVIMPMRV